jgi:hypothetical protein
MMGLLFRYDVFPRYVIEDDPGYESIVKETQAPVARTMAVMHEGQEVGVSHTVMQPEPDGTFRIANITTMRVKVGYVETKVLAELSIKLDKEKEVDRISLTVDLGGAQKARMSGLRQGSNLVIEINFAGKKFVEEIPYDNSVISSYFNPFPLGSRLKVGQSWRTKFLDPLSQQTRAVEVKVVAREAREITVNPDEGPRRFDTFKVVTDWDGTELAAWATEDGVVLEEQTPLGYTLVYREEPRDD